MEVLDLLNQYFTDPPSSDVAKKQLIDVIDKKITELGITNGDGSFDPIFNDFLGSFDVHDDRVYGLFDANRFYWPVIGSNFVNLTGYELREIENQRLFFTRMLDKSSLTWPLRFMVFLYKALNDPRVQKSKDVSLYSVGGRITKKNGQVIPVLSAAKCIDRGPHNKMGTWFGYQTDISHIFKGTNYWASVVVNGGKYSLHTASDNNFKMQQGVILTPRELEILKLTVLGKSSKQMSEDLFLSQHTIDTHRKHMIAKMGVKDLTGLAQIAKMTGML